MDTPRSRRRHWLVAAAGLTCTAWLPEPAQALDAPQGATVLTVTGALGHPNDNGAAVFDIALLASLARHSFSTTTPWYPRPRKFTGVLVSELVQAVGASAVMLRAVALNDYCADMPVQELLSNGAMIAYLLDDQPMPVRQKGPLVIIFPFSDRAELRTATQCSRAMWQLKRLELR
jgi:hypothetical protein